MLTIWIINIVRLFSCIWMTIFLFLSFLSIYFDYFVLFDLYHEKFYKCYYLKNKTNEMNEMKWNAPLGNTARRKPFPSAAPSELLSGSVIFWQRRLTALPLRSGPSSPLSGLLRSFPAGVCGTDRWQINDNSERLPQWETPRNAAIDSCSRLPVCI